MIPGVPMKSKYDGTTSKFYQEGTCHMRNRALVNIINPFALYAKYASFIGSFDCVCYPKWNDNWLFIHFLFNA